MTELGREDQRRNVRRRTWDIRDGSGGEIGVQHDRTVQQNNVGPCKPDIQR